MILDCFRILNHELFVQDLHLLQAELAKAGSTGNFSHSVVSCMLFDGQASLQYLKQPRQRLKTVGTSPNV